MLGWSRWDVFVAVAIGLIAVASLLLVALTLGLTGP